MNPTRLKPTEYKQFADEADDDVDGFIYYRGSIVWMITWQLVARLARDLSGHNYAPVHRFQQLLLTAGYLVCS